MNRHEIEGNWKQVKGLVREKWGELTDDDLDEIGGRQERLVGKLQERYGKSETEASQEVSDFFNELDDVVIADRRTDPRFRYPE